MPRNLFRSVNRQLIRFMLGLAVACASPALFATPAAAGGDVHWSVSFGSGYHHKKAKRSACDYSYRSRHDHRYTRHHGWGERRYHRDHGYRHHRWHDRYDRPQHRRYDHGQYHRPRKLSCHTGCVTVCKHRVRHYRNYEHRPKFGLVFSNRRGCR
jgi:hypothetical protein